MAIVKPHDQLLEEPPRIVLLQAVSAIWQAVPAWPDTALPGQGESAIKMPHPQAAAGLDKLEHVAARRKLHDNRQVVLRKEDLLELDDTAAGAMWSGSAPMLDSAQAHDYAFRQQALPVMAAQGCTATQECHSLLAGVCMWQA